MKIGIPYSTNECSQTVQALLRILGSDHTILLINRTPEAGGWWPDVDDDCVKVTAQEFLTTPYTLDLLLDVDGQASATMRAKAKRNAVLFRGDPSFRFLEEASLPTGNPVPYSLTGVDEVWVWDALVVPERLGLLRALFGGRPVRRVPFVWVPRNRTVFKPSEGTVDIVETNRSNTSSCIVPLLGCDDSVKRIRIWNAVSLAQDRYFQENVRKNLRTTATITYETGAPTDLSLIVAHTRFVAFREDLLDLAYSGVPMVHNSRAMRDMGLLGGYYPENDVNLLRAAIKGRLSHPVEDLTAFRATLDGTLERGRIGWREVLERPVGAAAPLPLLVPLLVSQRETRGETQGEARGETQDAAPLPSKPVLTVGFSDMWEGFDPADNFFLDLLRDTIKTHAIRGTPMGPDMRLLIVGPFGDQWKGAPVAVPKVMFSGEGVDPADLQDPSISLYLTHDITEDARHIRFPLWLTYLNWFSAPSSSVRNPNGCPLEYATKPKQGSRDAFCAFVVSNPTCQERNDAFEVLHQYKPVSSGGAYKNNIGGPIASLYGGGGAGDVAKFDFLTHHTFNLCFENAVKPGYVTEKLLHAKLAGCVPLYRGAPEALQDFDPSGVVLCNDMTPTQLVDTVRRLEADPEALRALAQTPALDPRRLAEARALLSRVGTALHHLLLPASKAGVTVCTFATRDFYASLGLLLQSLVVLGGPRTLVYLGLDVTDKEADTLIDAYPWVETRRLPLDAPPFPEFFEPSMYGWKLWMLKTLCAELDGPVLYTDAGASWLSWPTEMLRIATEQGVCLLTDPDHTNRGYCSKEMVREAAVTEEELDQRQLMAAFVAFRAKSEAATRLFDEAFRWASSRACLFGDKEGPNRHRHDQSLLSILSLRLRTGTLDGTRVACIHSARKTYQKAASVYHHRGAYRAHAESLTGVDDLWVVNLDRRADRWTSWRSANPSLQDVSNRLPAIDGKELVLTPALRALFQGNDFLWKQSVVGCALSHVLLWAQLACEHPSVKTYMILEDDQRFVNASGWSEVWKRAVKEAPADADLLYLGGVLPGNKASYESFLEPVNDVWATIRPNTAFSGGRGPPVPVFHFCTYAYILTRRGAIKLLQSLQQIGCSTSIDHYLISPRHGLRTYVMRNLMAKCFQDDDPVYQQSQFDDFKRVDAFDSDIWNNRACFSSKDPVGPVQPLWTALVDVLKQAPHSIQTRMTLNEQGVKKACAQIAYYMGEDGQMEGGWLRTVCPGLVLRPFTTVEEVLPHAWLVVARPRMEEWTRIARQLDSAGTPFRVLHLSDEGLLDPLDLYGLAHCEKVLRNYVRPEQNEKVWTLPLGFATPPLQGSPLPFATRDLVWSFHGTAWFDRPALLKPLEAVTPHSLHWTPGWKHATATTPEAWQAILLRTQCVPVPRGNHAETFRLYEALEHGCIPLYVRTTGDEVYWAWLRNHVTLMDIKSWKDAAQTLAMFQRYPDRAEAYRGGLATQWAAWKMACRWAFL